MRHAYSSVCLSNPAYPLCLNEYPKCVRTTVPGFAKIFSLPTPACVQIGKKNRRSKIAASAF